jgi:uncharacterized membrane protein YdbT with pleckstrin-like domain
LRENAAVADIVIRPTGKFVKMGAILALIVFLGLEIGCLVSGNDWVGQHIPAMQGHEMWIMALPPLILLWPLIYAMRRRLTTATITGDHLRFETGLGTRTTRNIQLSKVQDVRVHQRIGQRIFGVGDVAIETAGEASRLTLFNVDDPQSLADEIMSRTQHGTPSV